MPYTPTPIAYAARSAVITRLQDLTYGLNNQMLLIGQAAPYSMASGEIPQVNWATSFWQGDLDPKEIFEEEDLTYPYIVVAAHSETDDRESSLAMFSGHIEISIRMTIGWTDENPLNDYDTVSDLCANALIRCFSMRGNGPGSGLWAIPPTWPNTRLVYNSRISVHRSPLRNSGDNRERDLTVALPMIAEVVNGTTDFS